MKELTRKKKNILVSIVFLTLLIIGLITGLTLYFLIDSLSFLAIYLISFPFMVLVYVSLTLTYLKFDNSNNAKISFLVFYLLRFLAIILALGFSLLFLYLNNLFGTNEIYYIFIPPILFTIGYLLGVIVK